MRNLGIIGICGVMSLVGCAVAHRHVGGGTPDVEAAQKFDRHPLYWVGTHFEKWDLEHVEIGSAAFVTFSYGTCELPTGSDPGGCPVPLQIQIQPLCTQLVDVARAPIWRRRRVRGAPVGTIDSAPVMFTSRVQVKVYRGQGSDPGLPTRALRALRSVNQVDPVIDVGDPIPAPPRAVLAGSSPCEDASTRSGARTASIPGPLELGRWICAPQIARRACSGPVKLGRRYLYVLRTHCGILGTYFDGRLWRADPPLTDGSGNPPRAWDNPEALGTMRLLRANLAEFTSRNGMQVARFRPAPPGWKLVVCE
jgi:hypothetical protein